jgi:K+-transporting ATPase KdpF subunit
MVALRPLLPLIATDIPVGPGSPSVGGFRATGLRIYLLYALIKPESF